MSKLNTRQVGKFAEYFVKMELTLYGFDVYSLEMDNMGIDIVIRRGRDHYYDVPVKSVRGYSYISMRKQHFGPRANLMLALVLLFGDAEPELFLIPSLRWRTPGKLLVSRDFDRKRSAPEWGINLSRSNGTRSGGEWSRRTCPGSSRLAAAVCV